MLRVAALHAKKALSAPRYYAGGLFKVFTTDPVFLWAQAIAFKTLVTLLPLLLLAAGIFGLVLRQENPFETVSGFLRTFLPPSQSDGLIQLVSALQEASGAITIVGALFFLVAVVTLFGTLRYVVGAAMGETRHNMRTIVGGILFDLRMMAQVGTLFLLSFLTTAAVRVLSAQSGAVAARLGLDLATIESVTGGLVQAVTFLVPYVLTVGMLIQLYYFVPRPHPPSRSALAGAAVGAVLFEGAKNGFALYATYVAQFDRYAGEGSGPLGGLGGVFGLILAFVFWVYLSGLILVVGAVVAALHERRNRPRRSRLRRMWAQVGSIRRERGRSAAPHVRHDGPGLVPADPPDDDRPNDDPPPVTTPAAGDAASGTSEAEPAGDGASGGEAVRA